MRKNNEISDYIDENTYSIIFTKKGKALAFFCIDVEKEIQSKGCKNTQQQKTMRT